MKSFFSEKRGQKLGCVLYTGPHYTRVNTVSKTTNQTQIPRTLFNSNVFANVSSLLTKEDA